MDKPRGKAKRQWMEGYVHQGSTGQAKILQQQALTAQVMTSPQSQHCAHTPVTVPLVSKLGNSTTVAPRWHSWIGRLCHYFRAACETDSAVQTSLMLHLGMAELYEHFQHLSNTGSETDFEAAMAVLNRHFDPQHNSDYERFKL